LLPDSLPAYSLVSVTPKEGALIDLSQYDDLPQPLRAITKLWVGVFGALSIAMGLAVVVGVGGAFAYLAIRLMFLDTHPTGLQRVLALLLFVLCVGWIGGVIERVATRRKRLR
jgi:hypothetical protein